MYKVSGGLKNAQGRHFREKAITSAPSYLQAALRTLRRHPHGRGLFEERVDKMEADRLGFRPHAVPVQGVPGLALGFTGQLQLPHADEALIDGMLDRVDEHGRRSVRHFRASNFMAYARVHGEIARHAASAEAVTAALSALTRT